MKDPYVVLFQRQGDLERVRREVEALRTVIPLLADGEPLSNDVTSLLTLTPITFVQSSDDVRDQLETYYPIARHMRLAGSL